MRPRLRVPLWFELLAAGLGAGIGWWVLAHLPPAPHARLDDLPPVRLAFFGGLIAVINIIWIGLQAIGQATLTALAWAVNALWLLARAAGRAILEVGRDTVIGFKRAWGFVRMLYDDVLKPAWVKFWKFVAWAKDHLENLIAPVIKFLKRVRCELLKFYEKWVRPVLDTIELARQILRVFSALGIEWAKKLDRTLALVEEKIDAPFRFLLRKINEIINVVNRVVTADGLFQRLALIRSIERDIRQVSRAFVNWRHSPIGDEQYKLLATKASARTPERTRADLEEYLENRSGFYRPIIDEMAVQWRIYLDPVGRGI